MGFGLTRTGLRAYDGPLTVKIKINNLIQRMNLLFNPTDEFIGVEY